MVGVEGPRRPDGGRRVSAAFPAAGKHRFTVGGPGESGVEYEAVVVRFADAWQVFLSCSGKAAVWLCASADAPHADVYSVRTLLGDRLQEHYAVYARSLIKLLCDSLRTRSSLELDREVVLVLALDVHDAGAESFKEIMGAMGEVFKAARGEN